MRKRSSMQSNSNYGGGQHRNNKHRYQGGGQGGGNHSHGRPRKNYGALREKYMAQARDALAAGDRVMAEYFYQHADHCYRMMMEEGQHRQQHQPQPQNGEAATQQQQPPADEGMMPENTNALPAFITAGYEQQQQAQPVPVQNWEERDS